MGALSTQQPEVTPPVFKVRFAGGQDEPPHPAGQPRWYGVDAAGVLTVTSQAPEGTTTVRYSQAAWESVTEFVADPTYTPAAVAARAGDPVGRQNVAAGSGQV